MLATLVDEPFDDKGWIFETKWDGFRLVTEKRRDDVRLWSRNGIDVTTRYAVLLPALQKIEGSCIIDGELCALDPHGRSRFQLLQNALNQEANYFMSFLTCCSWTARTSAANHCSNVRRY
jgi:bifunctional non-homologous end joining protein LigD